MRPLSMTVGANNVTFRNFGQDGPSTLEEGNFPNLLTSNVVKVHLTIMKRLVTIGTRDALQFDDELPPIIKSVIWGLPRSYPMTPNADDITLSDLVKDPLPRARGLVDQEVDFVPLR
jgi:hypothetical protein